MGQAVQQFASPEANRITLPGTALAGRAETQPDMTAQVLPGSQRAPTRRLWCTVRLLCSGDLAWGWGSHLPRTADGERQQGLGSIAPLVFVFVFQSPVVFETAIPLRCGFLT